MSQKQGNVPVFFGDGTKVILTPEQFKQYDEGTLDIYTLPKTDTN